MNDLATQALQRWNDNRNRNPRSTHALYSKDGQYHGSFVCESDAHDYVDAVSDREVWIGDGYQVVRFR